MHVIGTPRSVSLKATAGSAWPCRRQRKQCAVDSQSFDDKATTQYLEPRCSLHRREIKSNIQSGQQQVKTILTTRCYDVT